MRGKTLITHLKSNIGSPSVLNWRSPSASLSGITETSLFTRGSNPRPHLPPVRHTARTLC